MYDGGTADRRGIHMRLRGFSARLTRCLLVVTALGTLSTVSIVCATRVVAQSLADIAKKEEERRKQAPASKVYTNQDLKPVPGSPPPDSGAAAPGDTLKDSDKPADATADKTAADKVGAAGDKGSGDKAAADTEKAPEAKTEKYWRDRITSARTTLDRDQGYAEAMQTRINALTTDFVNRDDPAQRSVIEQNRIKALAELDRLNKQIADDRKQIADIEEEARRAGVPPGWLR